LNTCKEGMQVFRMSAGQTCDGKQRKGPQSCDGQQQKGQRPPQAARCCKKAIDGKQPAADAFTAAPSLQKVFSADIGQYTRALVMEEGPRRSLYVWLWTTWQFPHGAGRAGKRACCSCTHRQQLCRSANGFRARLDFWERQYRTVGNWCYAKSGDASTASERSLFKSTAVLCTLLR